MTALAALWALDDEPPARRCRRMLEAQAIYGPDGAAQVEQRSVALGRRLFRLSRADEHDRGPVRGGGGTLSLVADVRIDNRDALAAMLGLGPIDLADASDPMLLMRVIERWGTAGLARVVGPFALILWDVRAGRLVLARDPLGERPLHYHRGDRLVAAASMPKGLHTLPDIPYAADVTSAADFLALVPETGTRSFFAGIERVSPGQVVTIDARGIASERFWNWSPVTLNLRRDADYVDALREAFDRAVQRRLDVVDGRIATHLSGGLDSSAVAATAATLLAPGRLLAFTAVPSTATPVPDGAFADEGPLAALTAARHPNIDHVPIESSGTSPLSLMDRHFQVFERPVLNPSNAVWTDAIADAAKNRGVRVLLTGQMGNLTISHAGIQRLPQLIAGVRPVALGLLAWRMACHGATSRSIAAAAFGPFLPHRWWAWLERTFANGMSLSSYSAIRDQAVIDEAIEARAADHGLDLGYRPWRDGRAMRCWALSRVDMGVYNKGVLGGWGVDMRDPTSDRDLIALCLSIPEQQYILDGVPRSLARRAFADRLPAAVVGERRRGFQASDWHVALTAARRAIATELDSLDRNPVAARLIDIDRLRTALDDWPDGDWNQADRIERYQSAMLRGLAAGHFLRRVARTN